MLRPSRTTIRFVAFLGALLVVTGLISQSLLGFTPAPFHKLTPSSVFNGSSLAQWSVSQPVSGRVLVTGGGGNLGKHIVRRLLAQSTPVTILDLIFHPDELQAIHSDYPQASSFLTVVNGDIRDPAALQRALTPDVIGIIHLAAISRVLWCAQNEPDCTDINVHGTQLVLGALEDLNVQDSGKRWFLFASSREIYGDANVDEPLVVEDALKSPINAYGASKLKAEQLIESQLGRTRAISLRLSSVYGSLDDHVESFIPSLVTQALSHQTIQIFGGEEQLDMLHIDDCVDAFMLAVKRLDQPRWFTLGSSDQSMEAFNVGSGSLAPLKDLVNTVIDLTQSNSALQFLPHDNRYPTLNHESLAKAEKVLGFKAKINVEEGVFHLVRAYLSKTDHFLAKQLESHCDIPAPVDLQKLDGCSVLIMGSVGGELHRIKPEGGYWTAVREIDPPEPDLHFTLSIHTTDSGVKKLEVTAPMDIRLVLPASIVRQVGRTTLPSLTPSQIVEGDVKQWDMTVDAESGTVRFLVPDSDFQLAPPVVDHGNFSLIRQNDDPGLFRLVPTCCPTPGPWPFSEDNPRDFMIEFQRTSIERPFLASPAKALCSRLRRAHLKAKGRLATMAAARTTTRSVRYSAKPAEWVQDGLPVCSNVCEHPTTCVDSGDCQCVLSACTSRERFPFHSFASSLDLSYPPSNIRIEPKRSQFVNRHASSQRMSRHRRTPVNTRSESSTGTDLVSRVSKLSWMTILRPWAARYINNVARFPNIYVSPLDHEGDFWRNKGHGQETDKLRNGNKTCFSADTSMQRGLTLLGVEASDAEMVFIPHFQGRAGKEILFSQYEWSLKSIPSFTPEKAIIPFTYDWGMCLDFFWKAWTLRETPLTPRPASMKFMAAWTVMADLNTPCFRPHQDVVIPPRTCISPDLYREFGNLANVRPSRDRQVLATFKGSYLGTWDVFRFRVTCPRTGWQDLVANFSENKSLTPVWDSLGHYSTYVSLLNDTVFCPLPGGTAGWTFRLIDVLYAGCIPVLFGDSAQYPFFDIIDWSKISIRIAMKDVDRLEHILLTHYTMEDIERLQTNIMLVRNAFIYPLDDTNDQDMVRMMVDEKGPLFFALHTTGMRLATKWPTSAEYDRP